MKFQRKFPRKLRKKHLKKFLKKLSKKQKIKRARKIKKDHDPEAILKADVKKIINMIKKN